jgi:hypothetical protein
MKLIITEINLYQLLIAVLMAWRGGPHERSHETKTSSMIPDQNTQVKTMISIQLVQHEQTSNPT